MILQNIIWKETTEETRELYYRGSLTTYFQGKLIIEAGKSFRTDTYMNLFDLETWRKYTLIQNLFLRIELRGNGRIVIKQLEQATNNIAFPFKCETREEVLVLIPDEWNEKIYFEIEADSKVDFYGASYLVNESEQRAVKLAVVICTYKREESLKENLQELKKVKSVLKENIEVFVVDNASELNLADESWVHLYHNPNTGGSGGFNRGMDEVVKFYGNYFSTHVLLMDDDVVVQLESVLRLYSLLSYMRDEHSEDIVAGRMFRLDKPWVQYTAAEIWNGGDLRHIGFELDMNSRENLETVNDNSGAEYSGWWFCCIPFEFVKDNRPLPFFLHCDDVEYGLRHGGTPIILNGIQVWHETYEYRQSPVMAYYDMRNSLIVNAMYGRANPEREIRRWKESISQAHVRKDYLCETRLIQALTDFLKGSSWFINVDPQKHQIKILKTNKYVKFLNKFYWRIAYLKFGIKEKKIYEVFRKCSYRNL